MTNIETTQKREKIKPSNTESYCCGNSSSVEPVDEIESPLSSEIRTRQNVRDQYAKIANGEYKESSPEIPISKQTSSNSYSEYTDADLKSIPKESNLGLGSGNPVELAKIQSGEIVVDLGSGAGIDCFLASKKVGKSGKVIGVDMTPQMIDRARENVLKNGYNNVEFRLGEIENLPIPDNSADVIISNCVINLSIDKNKVFQDAFRVLKPGGRLVVSDIVFGSQVPEPVKEIFETMDNCVSRALQKDDYLNLIEKAGFKSVEEIESQIIRPQNKSVEVESGMRKRKLMTGGKTYDVTLTEEEDELLCESIFKSHIKGVKPV